MGGGDRWEGGGGRGGGERECQFYLRLYVKLSDNLTIFFLFLFFSCVEWYRGYHYHHPSKRVRQPALV